MPDPYEVLGIPPDADGLAIRRAYQKLARRWHPALRGADPEAERAFRAAAEAYALLRDAASRRRWDERRQISRRSLEVRRGGFSGPELVLGFEELVVELLPADAAAAATVGTADSDIRSQVELDFEEAIRGVVVSLSVQRETLCRRCRGRSTACSECEGRGFEVRLERVRVRIPPGVGDGSTVRVRGQGNVSPEGTGDLYVAVEVRPHRYFRLRGADVHGRLPVTVAEASLGAALEVPTIDGPVAVKLPAGTRSGQRFRLPGRGIERTDGRRGDHYYQIEVVVPSADTADNRELLERLEQDDPRRDLPTEPI